MEVIDIPLSKLSFAQKLNLMEKIWDALTRDANEFESADWHIEILKDRENAIKEGKAKFSDLIGAKERIRSNIS
jgi:hypothetical protein